MQFSNYIIITATLIIVGLFLNNWQPPIKKQFIAMILLPIGALLGYFELDNFYYGFMIAGLVFYKDELVVEIQKVKQSFIKVKNQKGDVE